MTAKVDETHARVVGLQPEAPPATPSAPVDAAPAAPAAGEGEAAKVVEAAGLDMAAVQKEFAETGALSDGTFDALSKVGITKDMVATYIAGQEATAQLRDAEGYNLVGGQEVFSKMATWAAQNMSAEDQAVYNASVTGTSAQAKQAVLGLKAAYEAAMGSDPTLARGSGPAIGDVAPFASRAEVTQAMRDPRYRSDPAYRASVERRLDAMSHF